MARQGAAKRKRSRRLAGQSRVEAEEPRRASIDPAKQSLQNRALLSVYHYGRRGRGALEGRPTPLTILQLHRAVTALIEPLEEPGLPAIRLALAELCRTRASGHDAQVDREIGRLAEAFGALNEHPKERHAEIAGLFASIFREEQEAMLPELAYRKALQHMLDNSPKLANADSKRRETKRRSADFLLGSWEVARR